MRGRSPRAPIVLFTVATALASTVLPHAALAQDQETRNAALARTLFREGLELAEQERFEEAVERFHRAYRLRPAAAIAFNLAQSLVSLGRLVEAREQLGRVERDPDAGPVMATARQLLASIEPRIGELTVALQGPTSGVEVRIDGTLLPREAIGIAVPVDPGARLIEALRDGAVVDSRTIELPDGGAGHVQLEIPARAPTPAEVATSTSESGVLEGPSETAGIDDEGPKLWWVWLLVSAAAAGAAAAILVVALSGPEAPIAGNASPGVLTWP
jgi:hypothetical protein